MWICVDIVDSRLHSRGFLHRLGCECVALGVLHHVSVE